MNRLNKFVKTFLVASLSLAFLMPNAAITSNAAVKFTQVSKYAATSEVLPSNVLIETGTKTELFSLDENDVTSSGYKVKNVKSSSSNLKVYTNSYSYKTRYTKTSDAQGDSSTSNAFTITGYAKKAGTYTVSYNVTDINGIKILPTQTVTVVAKDDVSPFKKITYAGQSLWNNYGSRFNLTDTTVYSSKKKGKLIVKPASGYKIKKIEVGKYNDTETNTTDTYNETKTKDTTVKYTTSDGTSGSYTKYDEYYNEITGYMTYKKVKSGKKITLATVPYTNTRTYTTSTSNNTTYDYTGLLAPTYVRVTFFDKTTKKTFQWETTIYYAK